MSLWSVKSLSPSWMLAAGEKAFEAQRKTARRRNPQAVSLCREQLENQLRTKLQLSRASSPIWIANCCRRYAERTGRLDRIARARKMGLIEDVEKFRSHFNLQTLLERGRLGNNRIGISEAWPVKMILANVARTAKRCATKCRDNRPGLSARRSSGRCRITDQI